MKLLLCAKCFDVISLREDVVRRCACDATGGRYVSIKTGEAEISGPAIPLGIDNNSLKYALQRHDHTKQAHWFEASVLTAGHPNIKAMQPLGSEGAITAPPAPPAEPPIPDEDGGPLTGTAI